MLSFALYDQYEKEGELFVPKYKELLGESYDEFIDYWCEPNKNGKLRYELEKFFDVKRRVNTWIKNKSFN